MTPTDLKAWRNRMGYTQRAAAQAMGVSYQTYVALEQGWRDIQRYHVKLVEKHVALIGLMEIAETAMPDSYFRSDSRVSLARRALGMKLGELIEGN